MHIEFQLQTDKVLPLVRSRLKQQQVCILDVFSVPLGGQTVAVIIDHVHIPPTTRLERVAVSDILVYGSEHVSGSAIQVVQPFTLYLAPLAQLESANAEPLGDYQHPDLELVFNLKLVKAKDGLELRLDFAELRAVLGLPVPSDLQQTVKDALAAALEPTPLDLAPLEDLLGPFTVAQVALNAAQDLSFLVMRIEVESAEPDGAAAWGEFYKGHVDDHLQVSWADPVPVEFDDNGKPIKKDPKDPEDQHPVVHYVGGTWSLFVDEALLRPTMVNKLTAGLAGNSKFELDEEQGIDAYWDCSGHLPRLIITFSGAAVDVGFFLQDLAVEVTVTALLAIAGPTTIQVDVSVAYEADNLDEFWVELTSAIPVAFLGAVIGGAAGPIGGVVGALVGYAVGVLAGVVVVSVYEPSLPGQPHCEPVSDTQYVCTEDLDLPSNPLFGRLELQRVVALCDGPLFFGSLPEVNELADVELTSVDLLGFSYAWQDACGSPSLAVIAGINLYGTGRLHLCHWGIVAGSDPHKQFDGAIHVTEYAGAQASSIDIEITVAADALLPEYLEAPYPLQLLLQTNGGARQVTLDAIAPLSAAEQQQLEFGLVAAKADCAKLPDGFWSATGRFNPKWSVDPGPETDEGAARWWQVAVVGLQASEALRLELGSHTLIESTPDAHGMARADALLLPSSPQDLSIVRAPLAPAPHPMAFPSKASAPTGRAERRVRLHQMLLHPAAELRFASRCLEARLGRVGGVSVLFCATEGGHQYLYDVSNPRLPALRRRTDQTGVRGVVPWQDGFLLWGEHGVTPVTRELRCAPTNSPTWRGLPRGPVKAATVLRGELHLVGADGQLHVFDASGRKIAAAGHESARPRWLSNAPWFADVRRVGRTLARVAGDRIELWTVGRSVVLG